MEFVDYLQSQYLLNLVIVAGLAGWAVSVLAGRLPKGWIVGIVGLLPALVLSILISMIVVFGWMLVFAGGRAISMIGADLGGSAQFMWLLGIEFGLYAIGLALIVYGVARFRTRKVA